MYLPLKKEGIGVNKNEPNLRTLLLSRRKQERLCDKKTDKITKEIFKGFENLLN